MFDKLPGRNEPCWCGSSRKYKSCHAPMDNHLLSLHVAGHQIPTHAMIKTPAQIEKIRKSAQINIAVLDEVEKRICEGMPTSEIDRIVYDIRYDHPDGRYSCTAELQRLSLQRVHLGE